MSNEGQDRNQDTSSVHLDGEPELGVSPVIWSPSLSLISTGDPPPRRGECRRRICSHDCDIQAVQTLRGKNWTNQTVNRQHPLGKTLSPRIPVPKRGKNLSWCPKANDVSHFSVSMLSSYCPVSAFLRSITMCLLLIVFPFWKFSAKSFTGYRYHHS